jgi:hypothetical protein
MPAKRRIAKRRRAEQPAIDRLLAGLPIEFSTAAREELVAAVYFRDPELPPDAEQRGLALLAQWRAAGNSR